MRSVRVPLVLRPSSWAGRTHAAVRAVEDPPAANLSRFLKNAAERHGDAVALQIRDGNGWRRLTYRELDRASEALARSFAARGLKPGDHIAIVGESRPEWVIAFFAAHRLGGVVIPVDKYLKEGDMGPILKRSEAKLVVASKPHLPILERLSLGLPILSMDSSVEGYPSMSKEIQAGTSLPDLPASPLARDDTAVIIFTSGTTGNPKGVMLSHGNLLSNVESLVAIYPEQLQGARMLSILPLNHAFEMTGGLLVPLRSGGEVTYADQPTPTAITRAAQATHPEMMLVVPRVLEKIEEGIFQKVGKASRWRRLTFKCAWVLSRFLPFPTIRRKIFGPVHREFGGELRCFVAGGAPLAAGTQETFERFGFKVVQGYGMTEASPVLTTNPFDAPRKGSVGQPIPGVEIGLDRDGQILARGPNIMKGYFKDPKATAETIKNGWLQTGDLGYFDPDGYLFINGRIKDLIVLPNGKKVFPEEIEERLKGVRYVKEVCVLGITREGEVDVTAVVIPDEERLAADKIEGDGAHQAIWKGIEDVNGTMAHYKKVRSLILWRGEFPKTTTLKVKRKDLLKLLEAGGQLPKVAEAPAA